MNLITINGLRHYKFEKPKHDDPVILVQDLANLFDECAVAALNSQGQKVGYVAIKYGQNKKVFDQLNKGPVTGTVFLFAGSYMVVQLGIDI